MNPDTPPMTRSDANPRAPMHRLIAWVTIVLLTLVTHAWMGGLFFSLDDFDFIPDASNGLGIESYLMGGQAPGETDPNSLGFAFVIRPVLSLALQVDLALFGPSAKGMHWMSLLWHALTCICLFEVLCALRGKGVTPPTAWLATTVFALHPAKMGAVAWISTRGDLMVGTFALAALLALIRFRESQNRTLLALCMLFLLLAIGSKESGVVVPILLIVFDVAFLRPKWRQCALLASAGFLLIGGYMGLRYWRLGENMAYYAGETRIITAEILERIAASLPPTLACLINGSFLAETQGTTSLFLAVIPCVLMLGLTLYVGSKSNRLAFGVITLMLVLSLAPALRFLRESSAVNLSRLFYLPSLPLAVLLAWPATIWARAQFKQRLVLNTLACLLLIACTQSFLTEARLLMKTAHHSRFIIESIEDLSDKQSPNTLLVVEGVPPTLSSSPAIRLFLHKAVRPPFRSEALPVLSVMNLDEYLGRAGYMIHDGPVLPCRWNGTTKKLSRVGALIEQPQPPPDRVETQGTEGSIDLDAATRGIHHIVLETDSIGVGKAIDLKLGFQDGSTHTVHLAADQGMINMKRRVFYTRLSDWFVKGGRLKRLSYQVEAGGPAVTAIAFQLPLPMIVWEQPTTGSSFSLNASAPSFQFTAPSSCQLFALNLREKGNWRCFFRRDQCTEVRPGVLEWGLGTTGVAVRGSPILSWGKIAPALRVHLRKQGQGRLNMWAQLLGFESDSVNPVTQSMPVRFLFTP